MVDSMTYQKILIIDDDAELFQLASLMFKKAGAELVSAYESPGGLRKFFTHYPNLINLDIIISGQPRAGP